MNHNRFRWDYPTQHTRFPRTSAEAFGPYGMMPLERRGQRRTRQFYAAAVVVALATAALFLI